MTDTWNYRRGDIYLANLNPFIGSEQGGTRPVLLLQNNAGNFFCPTLIVAPITSQIWKKTNQPTHYRIEDADCLPKASMVMLEQIMTIDKRRVIKHMGRLSDEEMRAVDNCVEVSLGLCINEDTEAP